MRCIFAGLMVLLLSAAPLRAAEKKVEGPVTLQCGDMAVVLDGDRAWTIKQITYKDFPLLAEGDKLYSGTAADMGNGQWVGSGYGDEKVGSRSLTVDRKRAVFKEGNAYVGKEKITYEKRSKFGVYKLKKTMEIMPDEILQTHEYKRERSVKVGKLYAFMFPFTQEMNIFCAQVWGDPDLAKRFNGAFYGENAELLNDHIRWFGVFCTERHTGLVCWYGGEYKGEEEQTILLDKPEVREYHFRPVIAREGRGDKMEFTLHMRILACPTGQFPDKAAVMAGSRWGPKLDNK